MKKLLLLSALLIFACSSDDSSNDDDSIYGRWDIVSKTVNGYQNPLSSCEQQDYLEILNEDIIIETENSTILFPQTIKFFNHSGDTDCIQSVYSADSFNPVFLNNTTNSNNYSIVVYWGGFFTIGAGGVNTFDPELLGADSEGFSTIYTAVLDGNNLTLYSGDSTSSDTFEIYIRN